MRDYERLLELELSLIPLNGKVPAVPWKQYQTERAPVDLVEQWFARSRFNIGIVTGAISGIVVVDVDSPQALAVAKNLLPIPSMIVESKRGVHLYYEHPGSPVPNRAKIRLRGRQVDLDVRGDGGYIVAPRSRHESGKVYEFLSGPVHHSELPRFDPSILMEPQERRVSQITGDTAHRVYRALRYAEKVPGAIEKKGGDNATFRFCCKLIHAIGLTVDEAWPVVQSWNQKCVPPWNEKMLRRKLEQAAEHGSY